MGVDKVPVAVDEDTVPAVVVVVALELVTGAVVQTLRIAGQNRAVDPRVPVQGKQQIDDIAIYISVRKVTSPESNF